MAININYPKTELEYWIAIQFITLHLVSSKKQRPDANKLQSFRALFDCFSESSESAPKDNWLVVILRELFKMQTLNTNWMVSVNLSLSHSAIKMPASCQFLDSPSFFFINTIYRPFLPPVSKSIYTSNEISNKPPIIAGNKIPRIIRIPEPQRGLFQNRFGMPREYLIFLQKFN